VNDDNLKPCPFCGKTPAVLECKTKGFDAIAYVVRCNSRHCLVSPQTCPFVIGGAREKAIDAWNTRAPAD